MAFPEFPGVGAEPPGLFPPDGVEPFEDEEELLVEPYGIIVFERDLVMVKVSLSEPLIERNSSVKVEPEKTSFT